MNTKTNEALNTFIRIITTILFNVTFSSNDNLQIGLIALLFSYYKKFSNLL